jgi:hypothetical protein
MGCKIISVWILKFIRGKNGSGQNFAHREEKMKKILALVVLVLVMGIALNSCATYSTRGGVETPLGALTSASINSSRPVIAEYSVILGLITSGYEEFLQATQGKEIDVIDVNYFYFFRKVQAVAK